MYKSIEETNHRHAKRLVKLQEVKQRLLDIMIEEYRYIDPSVYKKTFRQPGEPEEFDIPSLIDHIGDVLGEEKERWNEEHSDYLELEIETEPEILRMAI